MHQVTRLMYALRKQMHIHKAIHTVKSTWQAFAKASQMLNGGRFKVEQGC